MRFSLTVAALLPVLAVSAVDIPVMVGETGLTFSPTSVEAQEGDNIVFTLYPQNHTVTQSSFADPCTRLASGVSSGFKPLDAGATATFTYTVANASAPAWFYCGQTQPRDHCRAGMVFAVNPTADKTFAMFEAAAKAGGAASGSATGSATGSASRTASSTGASASGTGKASGALPVASTGAASILALAGLLSGLLL